MTTKKNHKWLFAGAIIATMAGGGVAFGVITQTAGPPDRALQSGVVSLGGGGVAAAFFTPEDRVAASTAVVIGTLRGETVDRLEVPGDGLEPIVRMDLVRTFAVEDVLRGEVAKGSDIRVRWTIRLEFPEIGGSGVRPEHSNTPPEAVSGQRYAIFLTEADIEDEWFAFGEPSLAEIHSESVDFVATSKFLELVRQSAAPRDGEGMPRALDGLTLGELRALSAASRLPAPSPVSDPGIERALAIERLLKEVSGLDSAVEVDARAAALGFDVQARAADPAFCRKAETAVRDLSGFDVDFDCPG